MKSLQIILQYQQDFEALELAYHGHSPREKATSVGTINISSKSLGMEGITATPRPSGGVRSCPSWSIPCVSVDKEGNSYFSEKSVILSVGTPSGIGALSTLMPAVGEIRLFLAYWIALLEGAMPSVIASLVHGYTLFGWHWHNETLHPMCRS